MFDIQQLRFPGSVIQCRYRGQIEAHFIIDAQVAGLPGHLELGTRKIARAMATKSFSLCQNAKAIVTFSTNVMRTNSFNLGCSGT